MPQYLQSASVLTSLPVAATVGWAAAIPQPHGWAAKAERVKQSKNADTENTTNFFIPYLLILL
jgi:hypothetical protein